MHLIFSIFTINIKIYKNHSPHAIGIKNGPEMNLRSQMPSIENRYEFIFADRFLLVDF